MRALVLMKVVRLLVALNLTTLLFIGAINNVPYKTIENGTIAINAFTTQIKDVSKSWPPELKKVRISK